MPCISTSAGAPSTSRRRRAAGGTPLEFNSIAISDGSSGHRGHEDLAGQPRVIARRLIELTARGYHSTR